MAAPSLGLPAGRTCPAVRTCLEQGGDGAICRRCYAQKGRYVFKSVKAAQERRLVWWNATNPKTRASDLAGELRGTGSPSYFRCYDSGDLQDRGAADTWLHLADMMPAMHLWLPTHTWVLESHLPWLRELNAHPRIVVRPSAVAFGDHAPAVEGLAAGMSAPVRNSAPGLTADRVCPGQCGDCRLCWDAPELSVEFHRK